MKIHTTPINAIRPAGSGLTSAIAQRSGESFAASLNRAAAGATSASTQRDEVRKAAEQFVASSLIAPLLAQARNSPFKTELFHGGQAEDIFGQQLDTEIAERMVTRMNFPLVDSIERFMLGARSKPTGAAGKGINLHG